MAILNQAHSTKATTFTVKCKPNYTVVCQKIKSYFLANSDLKYDDKHFEYLIIVGGDGSFLKNVHKYVIELQNWKTKIVTINKGKMGFFMQFDDNLDDYAKIIRNIAAPKKENARFMDIPIYQAKITSYDGSDRDTYFINDLLFFSSAKAASINLHIHQKSNQHKIPTNYWTLFKQRGSGFLISTALGNFALMHSTQGNIFVEKTEMLSFKSIYPIQNRNEYGITNSFLFKHNLIFSIAINCHLKPVADEKSLSATSSVDNSKEAIQQLYGGQVVIDGYLNSIAPINVKVCGKMKHIKLLCRSQKDGAWRTLIQKVV